MPKESTNPTKAGFASITRGHVSWRRLQARLHDGRRHHCPSHRGTGDIRAHRTGVYVGKSEAQFGPIVDLGNEKEPIRGPEWAMVTVRRSVGSVVGEWSEKLYLAETRAKNKMWRERPHFMLAKCAEASALRAAFPELDLRYIEEEMMGQNLAGSATFEPSPKLSAFVDRVISRCSGTGNWEGGKQILHDRLEDDQLAWAMEQLRAASMTLEHVAA